MLMQSKNDDRELNDPEIVADITVLNIPGLCHMALTCFSHGVFKI